MSRVTCLGRVIISMGRVTRVEMIYKMDDRVGPSLVPFIAVHVVRGNNNPQPSGTCVISNHRNP